MEAKGLNGMYKVISKNGLEVLPLFYVRNEHWDSTGEDWETFFTMIYDLEAHADGRDFSFCRMRTLAEKISVDGEKVIESPFTKRIIIGDEHTPLVNSWLNDARRITEKIGYPNIDEIFKGNKTWNCRSVIPPCVDIYFNQQL